MANRHSTPLRVENRRLRRENKRLHADNERLRLRVAELQRRLDEAVRASKRQAAPFSKGAPTPTPRRRGRKPGATYGVRAHRLPPEHIDEIIDVPRPDRCGCGGQLDGDAIVSQYQTDIPVKPIHRRLDIHFGTCTTCGRRVSGRHPLQTSSAVGAAAAQLGPQAQAMVATLKDEVGVSYGDIQKIFLRGWGIPITRGGAAQIVLRVGRRLDEPYRGILLVVRRSRVVYPDETGWKVAGLLWWMWVFVARTVTAFVIRDSRGHDVPEALLGADWSGTMVHDGWAPYDFFQQAQHQQCLGHIQRRCKALLQTATRGAVRYPRAVLQLTKDAFGLRDRRDAGLLSSHGLLIAAGRLQSRLAQLLEWRLSNPANRKLARHLGAHQDELFVFLKRRGIEATRPSARPWPTARSSAATAIPAGRAPWSVSPAWWPRARSATSTCSPTWRGCSAPPRMIVRAWPAGSWAFLTRHSPARSPHPHASSHRRPSAVCWHLHGLRRLAAPDRPTRRATPRRTVSSRHGVSQRRVSQPPEPSCPARRPHPGTRRLGGNATAPSPYPARCSRPRRPRRALPGPRGPWQARDLGLAAKRYPESPLRCYARGSTRFSRNGLNSYKMRKQYDFSKGKRNP